VRLQQSHPEHAREPYQAQTPETIPSVRYAAQPSGRHSGRDPPPRTCQTIAMVLQVCGRWSGSAVIVNQVCRAGANTADVEGNHEHEKQNAFGPGWKGLDSSRKNHQRQQRRHSGQQKPMSRSEAGRSEPTPPGVKIGSPPPGVSVGQGEAQVGVETAGPEDECVSRAGAAKAGLALSGDGRG